MTTPNAGPTPDTPHRQMACAICHGQGGDWEPEYYDDGTLSRTLAWVPCPACSPPPVDWQAQAKLAAEEVADLRAEIARHHRDFARWEEMAERFQQRAIRAEADADRLAEAGSHDYRYCDGANGICTCEWSEAKAQHDEAVKARG